MSINLNLNEEIVEPLTRKTIKFINQQCKQKQGRKTQKIIIVSKSKIKEKTQTEQIIQNLYKIGSLEQKSGQLREKFIRLQNFYLKIKKENDCLEQQQKYLNQNFKKTKEQFEDTIQQIAIIKALEQENKKLENEKLRLIQEQKTQKIQEETLTYQYQFLKREIQAKQNLLQKIIAEGSPLLKEVETEKAFLKKVNDKMVEQLFYCYCIREQILTIKYNKRQMKTGNKVKIIKLIRKFPQNNFGLDIFFRLQQQIMINLFMFLLTSSLKEPYMFLNKISFACPILRAIYHFQTLVKIMGFDYYLHLDPQNAKSSKTSQKVIINCTIIYQKQFSKDLAINSIKKLSLILTQNPIQHNKINQFIDVLIIDWIKIYKVKIIQLSQYREYNKTQQNQQTQFYLNYQNYLQNEDFNVDLY